MKAKRPTAPTRDPHAWQAIRLKDERTGDLSYQFVFPVGDGTVGTLELSADLPLQQMAQKLARRTTLLPRAGATKFVENLVADTEERFIIKARQPGWKQPLTSTANDRDDFTCFVTPGQIIGPGRLGYCWGSSPGRRPHIGQSAGTLEAWSASVGCLAEQSHFIAFAIMFALATPLLAFADLPEDPAFNLFGQTSIGKTTAAKVGASVLGHPDSIRNWDISERGLEETCADHNDLMAILNAAERTSPKHRGAILNRMIHMVTERESTVRSGAVQEHLPNLMWRTGLLSTSNKSGAQMAAEAGLTWNPQEAVRFIDIPIPPAAEGGIFDRLGNITDKATRTTELIRDLEKALLQNYGVLLRPWIEHLLATDARARVARLITRFDQRTGPHQGLEDRVSRKFGLVYAAGKMAITAGLLPWPGSLPLSATKALLVRAQRLRGQDDQDLGVALSRLIDALDDPRLVRPAISGRVFKVPEGQTLLGVRYTLQGQSVVGLRKEGLVDVVGPNMADAVQRHLADCGALLKGHGGKSTRQLPLTLEVGGTIQSKPRFLVIDPGQIGRH